MAASRFLSLLAAKVPRNPCVGGEISRTAHPCSISVLHRYQLYSPTLSTLTESRVPSAESSQQSQDKQEEIVPEHQENSRIKVSERHDMVMVFTCKVCETRSMRTACKESYDKGVVVVRCDGCNNLHLIADRLGWFGEPGSVEDLLAARGEEVKKDSVSFTLEDLVGKKNHDV